MSTRVIKWAHDFWEEGKSILGPSTSHFQGTHTHGCVWSQNAGVKIIAVTEAGETDSEGM